MKRFKDPLERSPNFELKTIKLNGNRVKVLVPKKSVSLENSIKLQRKILKKYIK